MSGLRDSDLPPRSTRHGDDFFDGLFVGTAIGMAAILALFAVMAAAEVYGG